MPFSTAEYDRELREAELAELVQNFRRRVDSIPTPLFLCDIAGACVVANQAYLTLMECSMEEAIGWNWSNFIHPDDKHEVYARAQNSVAKMSVFDSNHRFVTSSGRTIYVHATTHPLIGTQEPVGFIGTIIDETEKNELINELRQRDIFMKAMTDAMREGILVRDKNGEIIHCNDAAEQIFSLTRDQITGKAPVDEGWHTIKKDGTLCAPEEHPAVRAIAEEKILTDIVLGICLPNKTTRWISVNASPLRNDQTQEVYGAVSTFIDITQRINFQEQIDEQIIRLNETYIELDLKQDELQQLNSKLLFQAETDALTLIFNRGAIMSRFEGLAQSPDVTDYGVILLDIDHFKSINDTLGHTAGDQTLQIMASLLSEYAPNGTAVGRYGGEEFLLVCRNCTPESLINLAEEIRSYIEYMPDGPVRFTASLGVAHVSNVADPSELIKCADIALYESKNNGRNRTTSYTSK